MFEAAKKFYAALDTSSSKEEIELLRQEMAYLEAEYSDNPAYMALIKQEFTAKKLEVDKQ